MPAIRLSMRKVRDVLRLKSTTQLSQRQISIALGIAQSTIIEYLGRATVAGLSWPLPEDLDDEALEALLFIPREQYRAERPLPEWARVHSELQRKGVTLLLLWQEYRADHPDGYNYSRFCELYSRWRGSLDVVMRQSHTAGEKLFVDYAGLTIMVIDPDSGAPRQAQVFVATLGASSYTYAEATWTQDLSDWIGAHVRAFAFFGGVPEVVVPDNLRSGVSKAHRYAPAINRSYAEMARHYGVTIIPARVRKPRDKGKVESGVQVVEQWILAALRDHRFFSLQQVNQAIAERLTDLNARAFQALPGSRRTAYDEIDRPALRPLPVESYEFAEWKKVRPRMDYHIQIDGHFYSVPYRHAGEELAVRLTASIVECYRGMTRIASHLRSDQRGGQSTVREHMPESHQRYIEATAERAIDEAARIGAATAELARRIIARDTHPEQSTRLLGGILHLGKAYGAERLESAAARALVIGALGYQSIESILKQGLDRQALPERADEVITTITHDNLRGACYYAPSDDAGTFDPSIAIDARRSVTLNADHLLTGGSTYVEHTHA